MATLPSAWRRTAAVVVALVSMIGCASDAAVAPTPVAPDAATALAMSQNITLLGFQQGKDTLVGKWSIPVNRPSVQRLGAHLVTFPAYAICEPGHSSYGPEFWDLPCTPSRRPVQLTVRAWMDKSNTLQLRFTPDIRFVPSSDPSAWVMLYMKEKAVAEPALFGAPLNIVWVPNRSATPVDESLTDPTLRTQTSPVSGYVYRRIKHFSGYTVAAGRSATYTGAPAAGISESDF